MGRLVNQMAEFVSGARYEHLGRETVEQLKIRVLDSLGCALGALKAPPMAMIRGYLEELGGRPRCTLIGGGQTSPDRAAFANGALVRYLDYNDSYLAPGETCHPSDNFAAVLAAGEYAETSGRHLLTALAVAYQVQCRLSEVAPVRAKGFDHTTQGSYAVAAGVCKALDLSPSQTANAVAISGTAFNALRVTRTGSLSHWKGLAYPNTAFAGTHAAFLAKQGITGPAEVFEGHKGFMEAIAGRFELDWSREGLDRVEQSILKKYNAEIHSQSAVEGLLELQAEHGFSAGMISQIEVAIFDVAYHIIGGGEEGGKIEVHTKEEADHSLPYILAVAALDGTVMPKQYMPDRIARSDVQELLGRVVIHPCEELSRRFPKEMPCRVTVTLQDGRSFSREKTDYEGFQTRPMAWSTVERKFHQLSEALVDQSLREAMIASVADLESRPVGALTRLLGRIGPFHEDPHL